MSWPVPNSLMIEPTESEPKDELDRYVDALIRWETKHAHISIEIDIHIIRKREVTIKRRREREVGREGEPKRGQEIVVRGKE